jgi:hypothetical protein
MLVASRDPFHPGTHETAKPPRGSRVARAMSALQIAGTLLAIPVGIGSAYTMYRTNFTVDVTCQSLRGNIIALLDKSVDAGTRHKLVRHYVEAFEQTCGGVDPDATAAFKSLLSAEKAPAPAVSATAKPVEAKSELATRKAEPRPAVAVKQTPAVASAAKAEAAVAARDPSSDAVWIAAVRQALVSQTEAKTVSEPKPVVEQTKAAALTPAPSAEPAKPASVVLAPTTVPVARDIRPATETPASVTPAPLSLAPPAPELAPALPPATPVGLAPSPPKDDGHPVPPEVIPDSVPVAPVKAEEHTRSRLGEIAAKIPLVGWAINR